MKLSYLKNGETLRLESALCIGCGSCVDVCPHGVFFMEAGTAKIIDRARCMECGACALNCPTKAISVQRGVGCAAAIIAGKLTGKTPSCGGDDGCCSGQTSGCC